MGNPYAAKKKQVTVEATPEVVENHDPVVVDEVENDSADLGVSALTVDEVMELVGGDVELAKAALDEEREGRGRATLVKKLEEVVNE